MSTLPKGTAQHAAANEQFNPASRRVNVSDNERAISVAIGVLLATVGVMRMRSSAIALLALSSALAYRGFSGHCHTYQALGINSAEQEDGTSAEEAQEGSSSKRESVSAQSGQAVTGSQASL